VDTDPLGPAFSSQATTSQEDEMNQHYAETVHRDKMSTYYAEATGSRLAGHHNPSRLGSRIWRLVTALVRHESPSTTAVDITDVAKAQQLSKVG
jgi:hypothetical protein